MNLVGKIFTVLIFVMCLVFSSFALMLHAAHKNWYNEIVKQPDGYRDQIDKLAREKSKLQQDYTELQEQKTKDDDRYKKDKTSLEAANKELYDKINDPVHGLVVQNQDLQGANRKLAADYRLVQQNLSDLRDETEQLRGAIAKATSDRQSIWNQLVKATTDATNYLNEIAQLQSKLRPLAEEVQKDKTLLAYTGVRETDVEKNPPAGLTGEVTGVQQGEVEISLGYDDGIHTGQRFAVTRPSTGHYIGDVIVYQVPYPNRAVCRPDSNMMREQIQKYDHVRASLTPKRR